jgi:hypothetical protein
MLGVGGGGGGGVGRSAIACRTVSLTRATRARISTTSVPPREPEGAKQRTQRGVVRAPEALEVVREAAVHLAEIILELEQADVGVRARE